MRLVFFALFLSSALPACGGAPPPEATTPSRTTEASPAEADGEPRQTPWELCYATFQPSGDPRKDMAELTRACGSIGGMKAITPLQVGAQSDHDPVDRYSFYVPTAGKCYRVYATGSQNVTDLDLLVRTPEGDALAADVTNDSWPVLPPREPLCFETAGLYLLEVGVFKGAGTYAVQVWGR